MNPDRMNFEDIAAGVLACACEALTSAGTPVCVCEETIGPPALDSCDCQCGTGGGSGQLNLWVDPIYLSTTFPGESTAQTPQETACGVPLIVASMHVQISRCTTGELFGYSPVSLWHHDATIVRQSVGCCLAEMLEDKEIRRFMMGSTAANPESGGCAGSTLSFLVALRHCICPADPAAP